ncbi:MAG: DUF2891 domain-containing protein [Burkholderiaceae bacterium]
MRMVLDEALARRFARVALDNVVHEYPNKLDHLMTSVADVRSPSQLHPVFYGCYDWHSSVHMHWTLVVLLIRFPALHEADTIAARLDAHFTVGRIAGELAYLQRPAAASFERPYGWAWLFKLCEALHRAAVTDTRMAVWRDRMQPLADAFVARTLAYLPRAPYPSRAGMHANSAFALSLTLDYARTVGEVALQEAIVAKAVAWFGDDRDYPVAYETGSEDFLSAGLVEAMLMRRVFGDDDVARFNRWWGAFAPDVTAVAHWLTPLVPSDRSDARFSHIDGLNLARAWCWSTLADVLPAALQRRVRRAIDLHLRESLPHAAEGHYVGTHWLASFALLSLGA